MESALLFCYLGPLFYYKINSNRDKKSIAIYKNSSLFHLCRRRSVAARLLSWFCKLLRHQKRDVTIFAHSKIMQTHHLCQHLWQLREQSHGLVAYRLMLGTSIDVLVLSLLSNEVVTVGASRLI